MAPARDDSLSPSRSPTPVPIPEELSRPGSSFGRDRSPRGEKRRLNDRDREYEHSVRRREDRDREYNHSKHGRRDRRDERPRYGTRDRREERGYDRDRNGHRYRHADSYEDDRRREDYRPSKLSKIDSPGYGKYEDKDLKARDASGHSQSRRDTHEGRKGNGDSRRSHRYDADPRSYHGSFKHGDNGNEYDSHGSARDHIQSVPTKDHPSPEPSSMGNEAKSRFASSQQAAANDYIRSGRLASADTKYDVRDTSEHRSHFADAAVTSSTRSSIRDKPDGENFPDNEAKEASEQTSAEVSIEERRRRREAVKARLKSQDESSATMNADYPEVSRSATPSRPITPHAPSERSGMPSESTSTTLADYNPASFSAPSAASPKTPKTPLAFEDEMQSMEHVQISKDGDSVYTAPASPCSPNSVEEPSAADYDPTADMEEDRQRQNMRNAGNGMSAAAYDENREDPKQVLPLKAATEAMDVDQGGDQDENDDDMDMFASESPSKLKESSSKAAKKPRVPMVKPGDFEGKAEPETATAKDGYFDPLPGDVVGGRYKVQKTLGKGTFASVIRCEDINENKLVAIKVIKNNDYMKELGKTEIKNLKRINEADPEDKRCIVRFLGEFMHKQHLCLVFENLNINLRELIKKHGRNHGLHYSAVRRYARQMFLALDHFHKCETVHADLKPDNIIVDEDTSKLKVCDLGSAAELWQLEIAPYLASRFYRAPEIMLGVPYGYPIDIWSIGCTLFELYTAKILFTGTNNNEMLRSMQETRGKFNNNMIKKAELWGQHFTEDFLFRSFERDKLTGVTRERQINYKLPAHGKDIKSRVLKTMHPQADDTEKAAVALLVDLLEKCLQTNPEKRMTPQEALKHPFVAHSLAAQQGKTREKAPVVAASAAPVANRMFVPRSVLNAKKGR